MPNFLLWNVNRKPLDGLVSLICDEHQIDIVCLVEYPTDSPGLPVVMNQRGFVRVSSQELFGVFARNGCELGRILPPVPQSRVGYWRLTTSAKVEVLVVLLHGQDRRNSDDSTRAVLFRRVAEQVAYLERESGHRRTVILGDFNSNPFEPAMVSVIGLHALGVRQVRERSGRSVAGENHDFFYNPTWQLFGHSGDAGTATHYFPGYDAHELIWHMLDQVVIRPDAVSEYPDYQVRILTEAGNIPLVSARGIPDSEAGSDHLPLLFSWTV